MDKKNRRCNDYGPTESYNECVRKSYWSILKDKINCSLPGRKRNLIISSLLKSLFGSKAIPWSKYQPLCICCKDTMLCCCCRTLFIANLSVIYIKHKNAMHITTSFNLVNLEQIRIQIIPVLWMQHLRKNKQLVNMNLGMEIYKFNLTECSDRPSAVNAYNHYSGILFGSLRTKWNRDCPVPCQQTSYDYALKSYHVNSWLNPGKGRLISK